MKAECQCHEREAQYQEAGKIKQAAPDLTAYRAAKINWRQAEGESISVAVIPASYFEDLLVLLPQFEALTGVKVRAEKVPPGQACPWPSMV